ncbi:MAG TPA: peptidylprolyl isomerase [Bacteroidetes bacterium]|nr:peptidylprolyl isomerase [Bacteroidota bacterium]
MKVGKNKVVTLTYVLRREDKNGEVIQEVDDTKPFVHLFGAGSLLPAFEENLNNLEPGETFAFHVSADDAYGESSDKAIVELDKNIFEIDGQIDEEFVTVGKMVAMQDENGRPLDGKVLAIKDSTIVMDFNHPLAGQSLFFTGEIKDVREANEEELSHGHVHGHDGIVH